MKTFPTLFKKTARGGVQEWDIAVQQVRTAGGTYQVVMVTTFGLQDGKKQELREVISQGKNAGKKNATTPYQQACAEAESRWNKQKDRKGYGLSPDESAAVRSVLPMLAHVYKDHYKKVDWGTAFAQPKLNGFRCLAHVDPTGTVRLMSRENQPLVALGQTVGGEIAGAAKRFSYRFRGEEQGYILDGELYCHGMSLNQISSACKRKSELTDKIQYHIYDALFGDANFETRSTFAKDFIRASGSELLVPVETVKVRSEQELMHCQGEFLERGFEGAMLRYGGSGYQAGKRSDRLLKVKTWLDDEFVVVDYKMGRGKFDGVPSFTCVTLAGHEFDVAAGGTMEEKRALGAQAAALVGKMITVKYFEYTKTAEPVPFHPVMLGVREDAPAPRGKKARK